MVSEILVLTIDRHFRYRLIPFVFCSSAHKKTFIKQST
ncbi:Uncharacterised protein [Yersinia intermedia]|jgi:hypothetical protein|nr:hypothetical protein CH53_3256 [Yersinia intermedia]CNB28933.1 Uncharacterised protein [Yersinia intermedia]CNB42245.1 Uncharacterised protein [Yersinia intermedia]CND80717.1 Uncharacterised protein [Yersinia intermedia]CNF96408.1 Uncharacterised protein [Yersinia intermedia]